MCNLDGAARSSWRPLTSDSSWMICLCSAYTSDADCWLRRPPVRRRALRESTTSRSCLIVLTLSVSLHRSSIVFASDRCSVLQCVGALQCVVMCCDVLQCVVVCYNMFQCVAVCCSVLQSVAVRCSALQYVAVCCELVESIISLNLG